MKTKQFENISLVIIDQLRADYAKYFEKCSKLLPYQAICDTASIPSSTEAMHANISFGVYPKEHGMISRSTRDKGDGLQQIIRKMDEETVTPLASVALKHGYKHYLIGGKLETVRVLGNPKKCDLFLQYNKQSCLLEGMDEEVVAQVSNLLGAIQDKEHVNLDAILFDIYKFIISTQENYFAVLTLPILDSLGHEFGAGSPEVVEHIQYLDTILQKIIEKAIDNTVFIVTGDHGCRNTTRYVIESDEKYPRKVKVYEQKEKTLVLSETYFLDKEKNFVSIEYDGGILRIWNKKAVNYLSVEDTRFLSKYGTIFQERDGHKINGGLQNIVKRSRHENLGDVFVIAHPEVTFCKHRWIYESTRPKIKVGEPALSVGELPIGEHGTYYPNDREIHFMSNYDFNIKMIENIGIKSSIENLIEILRRFNENQK